MPAVQIAPQQQNAVTTRVVFRNHARLNPRKSKDAGRPIYDDVEVCDVYFAGNTKTVGTFPAHAVDPNATRESIANGGNEITYAMRYNQEYKAFKAGDAQAVSGTPIAELPFLTEGKRRELKALNIYTAEALAALDGSPLKQLGMGGRELKNQAQAYLDKAANSADVTKQAAENAALKLRMEEMEAEMARMQAQLKGEPVPGGVASDEADEPSEATPDTDFDGWTDVALKDFIAAQTGERPRGNPNHATLVAAARELGAWQ